jgi:hypothetical protein
MICAMYAPDMSLGPIKYNHHFQHTKVSCLSNVSVNLK